MTARAEADASITQLLPVPPQQQYSANSQRLCSMFACCCVCAFYLPPAGPRRPGEGVENEEQGILSAEEVPTTGCVWALQEGARRGGLALVNSMGGLTPPAFRLLLPSLHARLQCGMSSYGAYGSAGNINTLCA